jgi:hypothetical protein
VCGESCRIVSGCSEQDYRDLGRTSIDDHLADRRR